MYRLDEVLDNPEWLPPEYTSKRSGDRHWALTIGGHGFGVVTTDRGHYEYALGAVRFFGPGCSTFPVFAAGTANDCLEGPSGIQDILDRNRPANEF